MDQALSYWLFTSTESCRIASLVMDKAYSKLELPLLDAQLFLSGTPSERRDFAIRFRDSLYEHGFARVINHGIDESMVDELFDWVRIPWQWCPF